MTPWQVEPRRHFDDCQTAGCKPSHCLDNLWRWKKKLVSFENRFVLSDRPTKPTTEMASAISTRSSEAINRGHSNNPRRTVKKFVKNTAEPPSSLTSSAH